VKLSAIREQFAKDYRRMLDDITARKFPTAVCTIYDGRADSEIQQHVNATILTISMMSSRGRHSCAVCRSSTYGSYVLNPMKRKRVGIYARYSDDLSDARSNEDQIEYCMDSVARSHPDWDVVLVCEDAAISGSAFGGRPGAQKLLQAERNEETDIILAEHPDRISRDTSDLAGLHRDCEFLGIEVWGVNTGKLNTITAGFYGAMAQAQREEIAYKVHRGMKPKFERDGQFMGGCPYGYRAVIKRTFDIRDRGKLEVDPYGSKVVVRIYEEYVGSKSPHEIAHGRHFGPEGRQMECLNHQWREVAGHRHPVQHALCGSSGLEQEQDEEGAGIGQEACDSPPAKGRARHARAPGVAHRQ
jgi:DNA invertase Pin-like site-specific DNA recombinase